MPIDLEMLLSATSPMFYPFSIDTATYTDSNYGRSLSFPQNHCVPRNLPKHQDFFHKKPTQDAFANSLSYKSKKAAPNQELFNVRKKKVSFADDRGFNLVEVCEIPGAPKWADDVITLLIGSTKRSVVKEKKWKVAFEHPPWPEEKLVDTLEKNKVALEHISVTEGPEDYLCGSVKVKNLTFEKHVFLRVTFDRWLSYVDVPCTYMKPMEKKYKLNAYDSFYFSTKILPVASRYEVIEFCVCFKCDKKEYWDNNGGINYRLTVEYSKSNAPDLHPANVS